MSTDAFSAGIPTSVAVLETPTIVFTGYNDIQENIAMSGNTCVWGDRRPTEDDMAIRHGEILVTSHNSAGGESGELVVCSNLAGVEINTNSTDPAVRAEHFYREARTFGIARTTIEMKDGIPMSSTVSSVLQGGTAILNTSREIIRPGQLILSVLPDPEVHRSNRLVMETRPVDPNNITEVLSAIDFTPIFATSNFRELTGHSADLFSRLLVLLQNAVDAINNGAPRTTVSTAVPGFELGELELIYTYMMRTPNVLCPDRFDEFVKTANVDNDPRFKNDDMITNFQRVYAERLMGNKEEGKKVLGPALRCGNGMTTHYAMHINSTSLTGCEPEKYFAGCVYAPIVSNLYMLQ